MSMSEEERLLKSLGYIEESYDDNGYMSIGDFNDITKAIELIKKKDRQLEEKTNRIKNLEKEAQKYFEQGIEISIELEKKVKIIDLIISKVSTICAMCDKEIHEYIKQELEKGEYTNLDKVVKEYFEKRIEK